jgi:assimilatory nitrate reductase catalytic subunit
VITGRVSKPGASPFSITGQPNAMGGRETGGMATTLAAHLTFSQADQDIAARFWGVNHVAPKPGLKAVEMFDALADGRIKALWVMATNPILSLPNANVVEAALDRCPFLVVSEVVDNSETARRAHVVLPALAWGEKDGTVTNSERMISRQRRFMPPPGQARPDWMAVRDVGCAMGYAQGFNHQSARDVFVEFAAMTNADNDGKRALRLGPLADLTPEAYEALVPTQWPVDDLGQSVTRPFAHGNFPHPNGRARIRGVRGVGPARALTPDFPLALNTGRLRDQWHTMTRTGTAVSLMRHAPEPLVDINPEDASLFGVTDGDLCHVKSAFGVGIFKARLNPDQRVGDIFVPMHFSDAFAPHARANRLTNPDVDALSGQPEFKHTPATIGPVIVAWRGFLAVQTRRDPPNALWWSRTPEPRGHLYEISACDTSSPTIGDFVAQLKDQFAGGEFIEMSASNHSFARLAILVDGQLIAFLAATTSKGLPQRGWLLDQLGTAPAESDRALLLQGGAIGDPAIIRGQVVCACFDVSVPQIEAYAAANPTAGIKSLGRALKAGTNCGSCRAQIGAILKARQVVDAKETQNVEA